jgi:cyanate permease
MSIALIETNWESRSLELVRTALRLSTLALAAVAIAANFTDYGPLIPLLQQELHITDGATGLLSTLLYVGIGLSYLPGGWLADRYGSRRVLFGSLLLVEAGGCLLPLVPNLAWIVLCRFVIGLGAGAAIVAGSQAARGGKYSAFGQGLFGGAMQLGAGLGLFATPMLQSLFGWRGTFTAWGALGLGASVLCLLALSSEGEAPQPTRPAPRRIAAAFRSPSLWTIGLILLGTLGLGQAIAPWLAVYFSLSYGLPLGLAATLGSVGLLAGMIFRPLGGALLSRGVFTASALMRTGTALVCVGVVMLALPLHAPLVTGWGLALFAFGTTFPYAAVFDEASRIGAENALGSGTAQGVISVISAPASAFGPLLIGGLLGQHGDFTLSFGTIALLGGVALVAALFVGPIVSRTRDAGNLINTREPDSYLAQALTNCSSASLPASTPPLIVAPCAFPPGGGTTIIRRLQRAGGLPLVLPALPSPAQGEAGDLLADEDFFREIFDRRIWPLFCQLLLGQTRGLCLVEDDQRYEKTNGATIDTGDLLQRDAPDSWSAITQRYLSLLAWLVGMPVIGAGWELQSLQLTYRVDEQAGTAPKRLWPLPANPAACSGSAEGSSVFSQFVAACAMYTPPSPQALASLRDEIFGWLRRRDRALVRQMYQLQLAYGQGTTGTFEALEPVPTQRPVEQEVAGKAGSRKKEKIAA